MKQHGTVIITGSLGLLGSALVRQFAPRAELVVGIDNGDRGKFFGPEGETLTSEAINKLPSTSKSLHVDVTDRKSVDDLFHYRSPITAVFHCAAQPTHDYSATHPLEDFHVNALGTMYVLEAARRHCPEAPFVFASSSKVYGDSVNKLPLRVEGNRFAVDADNPHARGILETLSIDGSMHSPYGAGKASADLYVQEYGRYYGMRTACFRPGTITGPDHAAVELHGFLAYLVKCCATGRPYVVNGYGGYQVRDVIHADDLARAMACVADDPPEAGKPFVTNFGGGMGSNCSMLEAIEMAEKETGRKLAWTYNPTPRRGDHMWFVGSVERFMGEYGPVRWGAAINKDGMLIPGRGQLNPSGFSYSYTLPRIVAEIADRYRAEGKVSA